MQVNKKRILLSLLSVALVSAASAAHATVVLSDNFNTDPQTLNSPGDTVFTSNTTGNASVDLIGTGFFDFYPGNGNYVDLDGSTGSGNNPAGRLDSVLTFSAGTYTLSFDLGGNQRTTRALTTDVVLGSFSTSLTLNSNDPLAPHSYTFTTNGGQLSFIELGPSDQQGNILDNVTLSSDVPEPTTLSILGAGLLALGFVTWRRRRAAWPQWERLSTMAVQ
jgi:hypothetical protein